MKAWPLAADERTEALRLLGRDPVLNLPLIDLVLRAGEPAAGEAEPLLLGLWRRRELVALGALRPCVMLSADAGEEAVAAFAPLLDSLTGGLAKTPTPAGDLLAGAIARSGRPVIVDRWEHALWLRRESRAAARMDVLAAGDVRRATLRDLPALVESSRASLVDEGRPDPHESDPEGFRRWVKSRMVHARLREVEARPAFVAYADIRRPLGWGVQGVYTWPHARRRGLARGGVAAIVREAFLAGAEHVQLAVVESNRAARALYEQLGFETAGRLRTLLFV